MANHYKPEDVAALLGVPRNWVMRHLNELPHRRVGKHIKFSQEHVDEIEAMFERRPQPDPDDLPGLTKRSAAHAARQR